MTLTDPFSGLQQAADRYLGRYRGTVLDVDDPKSLGRVKVRVPEVLGDVDSGWALPAFAATGDGSGIYGIPPVGAGVGVEFEAGDLARPVWVGGWYADGALPEGAGPENNGYSVMELATDGTIRLTGFRKQKAYDWSPRT